jgi:hypothetical protein
MKDIIGYEGLYAVDETGKVWSYRKNAWLSLLLSGVEYHQVDLWKNKKRKAYKVHKLVAQAFLENYSDDLNVDHINGDIQNNHISNLRMVTHQQNHFNRTTAKGYCWDKKSKKWKAQIKVNYKAKHLGFFNTEAEARYAYLEAKKIYHVI